MFNELKDFGNEIIQKLDTPIGKVVSVLIIIVFCYFAGHEIGKFIAYISS